MINRYCTLVALLTASFPAVASDQHGREMLEALAAQHAKAHGVPVGLVHRVIMRESRYNPSVISRGNYGLMQIRHATARGMGYNGPASGLLDPHINLTYAVPYLANAYRVAGRNQDRAVALYTSGYYYDAKRKGLLGTLTRGAVVSVQPQADPAPAPANALEATLSSIFAPQAQSVQALEVASTDASPAPTEKRRYRRAAQKRAKGTVSASPADSATTIRAAGNVATHTKRPAKRPQSEPRPWGL